MVFISYQVDRWLWDRAREWALELAEWSGVAAHGRAGQVRVQKRDGKAE